MWWIPEHRFCILILNYSWAYKNAQYCKALKQFPWIQSNHPQKCTDYPLWSLIKLLWNCQGTLIVSIPTVQTADGYLPMSCRTPFYKDSCYTVWMWWILLNGLPLQQFLSALSEWCPPVASAYWLAVPAAWTNWIGCRQAYEVSYGLHLLFWNDCWQQQSQIHFCFP